MSDEEDHSESEFYHPDELQFQDNSDLPETNNVNLEIVTDTNAVILRVVTYRRFGNAAVFRIQQD